MAFLAYFLLFASSLSVAWVITKRAIRWAPAWGMVDEPGDRKVHSSSKPRLGGLGIYCGFYVAIIAAVLGALFFPLHPLPSELADFIRNHRPGVRLQLGGFFGLLAGGTVMFLGGLLDDRKDLGPSAKIIWQLAASSILIFSGFRLDFHTVFWDAFWTEYLIAVPVTLFWMLFLINAFNLLDNMDGLSGGVAAITTSFFLLYAHWQGEFFLAGAMACLVGALLGFLRFNWNPSRIFMGDSGALLVGLLIAAFTCRCTYYQTEGFVSLLDSIFWPGETQAKQGILSLLTPLVIMAVPIFDTASVILIRIKNRKPIMVGDTNHFSHRLVALGLSQKNAVKVIYLATVFTGLGALILRTASMNQAVLIFLQVISVFGMIWVLEQGRKGKS